MKTLVLGAEGMLGSEVMRALPNAWGTTRQIRSAHHRIVPGIDISSEQKMRLVIDLVRPDVIVNCAGVVKSECGESSTTEAIRVNGGAPHMIAKLAEDSRCTLVHISTDCVFNGARGDRTESDVPDASDVYGRSKSIGELVSYQHCVTLRTSFIGRDQRRGRGLLEWLLRADSSVAGYINCLWSGVSSIELARVIKCVAENQKLSGLYHVAGPRISKSELLRTLIHSFGLSVTVDPELEPVIDRTLCGDKFCEATGYRAPSWFEMAEEMARNA